MRIAYYVIKDPNWFGKGCYWTGYGWSSRQVDAVRYVKVGTARNTIDEAIMSGSADDWRTSKVVKLVPKK